MSASTAHEIRTAADFEGAVELCKQDTNLMAMFMPFRVLAELDVCECEALCTCDARDIFDCVHCGDGDALRDGEDCAFCGESRESRG